MDRVQDVERISLAKATALILAAHIKEGLPFPTEIGRNGDEHLWLRFDSLADLAAWGWFFGLDAANPRRHNTMPVFHDIRSSTWQGWHVHGTANDPVAPKADDADLAAIVADLGDVA